MANQIIVISGPHEGVGKSTLAVNLAARTAQLRRLPVIVVDMDPLCRGEAAQIAGIPSSMSAYDILDQLATKQLTLPMLRGRIPLNRANVGTVNLAPKQGVAEGITNDQWTFFLKGLAQVYDVVVDLEATNSLRTITFDVADAVIWTLMPNTLSVRATLQQLESLQEQRLSLHKFFFALNQATLPHALTLETVQDSVGRLGKDVNVQLIYEPEIPKLINHGRPGIVDFGRSEYGRAVAQVADRLSQTRRDGVGGGVRGPVSLFSPTAGNGNAANLQQSVVDSMLQEKLKKWDAAKQRIHRSLVEELNIRRIDLDTKGEPAKERQLRTNVESTVNALIGKEKDLVLNVEERDRLVKELVDEALGLGPLEELLTDPAITEIMVNRFDRVYIERRGKITLSDKRFIDNNHVVQVIRRIIAPLGRRIDESAPMVDARLKDGSRVNAIISPLAVQGPTLTIRRFPEKAFGPDDLISIGAITRPMIDFLKVCVLMKKNIVISGGTGTGKTTILNMMSGFIPDDERIVTVEDTAELRLQQDHVVRLEARSANIEGQGQVTIRDLVKNSLRMRPDRIVIGECRGGEALDMLQAMNTGHDGSLTTVHSNSPRDAFTRLETLCLMAGMDLPVWALREQIRSAVHIVIQLTRMQDGSRKVTCITEVTGRNEETILTQDLFRYVQDSVDDKGKVHGHHEATGNIPKFYPELKAKGLQLSLSDFGKPSVNKP